jgi:hypothetical protein
MNQTGKTLRFYVKSVQVSPLILAAAHAHRSAEKIGYYVYFDFRLRLWYITYIIVAKNS